jgi:putative ATP-binding cassette transporter
VGKTALFRAMLGMWPFGSGSIQVPERDRTLFVGQKPYLPIGTLRAAVAYPESESAFSEADLRAALTAFGLGALVDRLDESEHWEQVLSAAEEQRLALARVLLHKPQWVFLDEATSALDDDEEREVYAVLERALPDSALITAVHRSAVAGFHAKRWELVPHDGGPAELRVAA